MRALIYRAHTEVEGLVAGGWRVCADGMDAEFKGTEVSGLKDPRQQGGTMSSPGGAPRGSICMCI